MPWRASWQSGSRRSCVRSRRRSSLILRTTSWAVSVRAVDGWGRAPTAVGIRVLLSWLATFNTCGCNAREDRDVWVRFVSWFFASRYIACSSGYCHLDGSCRSFLQPFNGVLPTTRGGKDSPHLKGNPLTAHLSYSRRQVPGAWCLKSLFEHYFDNIFEYCVAMICCLPLYMELLRLLRAGYISCIFAVYTCLPKCLTSNPIANDTLVMANFDGFFIPLDVEYFVLVNRL